MKKHNDLPYFFVLESWYGIDKILFSDCDPMKLLNTDESILYNCYKASIISNLNDLIDCHKNYLHVVPRVLLGERVIRETMEHKNIKNMRDAILESLTPYISNLKKKVAKFLLTDNSKRLIKNNILREDKLNYQNLESNIEKIFFRSALNKFLFENILQDLIKRKKIKVFDKCIIETHKIILEDFLQFVNGLRRKYLREDIVPDELTLKDAISDIQQAQKIIRTNVNKPKRSSSDRESDIKVGVSVVPNNMPNLNNINIQTHDVSSQGISGDAIGLENQVLQAIDSEEFASERKPKGKDIKSRVNQHGIYQDNQGVSPQVGNSMQQFNQSNTSNIESDSLLKIKGGI